ncbi:MAG: rod shape-determining protein MreD [Evtepia sp.]
MIERNVYVWIPYSAALFLLCLIQTFVLSELPLFGFYPALLPLTVGIVAVQEGAPAGAGYGMCVGLLMQIIAPESVGLIIFGLSLLGFVAGLLARYRIQQGFSGCFICSLFVMTLLEIGQVLTHVLMDDGSILSLLCVAGIELLYSMICFPLIYLLYHRIHKQMHYAGRLGN